MIILRMGVCKPRAMSAPHHLFLAFNPPLRCELVWSHANGVHLQGRVPVDVDDFDINSSCLLEKIADSTSSSARFNGATVSHSADNHVFHGFFTTK